jgi:hypothetical protein
MTNRPVDAAIERHLLQILSITAAAWDVPLPSLLVRTRTATSKSTSGQGWFVHRANPCPPVKRLRWAI